MVYEIGFTTLEMCESLISWLDIMALWLKLLSTIFNIVHKSFARGLRSTVQKNLLPPLHVVIPYLTLIGANLEKDWFLWPHWTLGTIHFSGDFLGMKPSAWLNMQGFEARCESNHSILIVGWCWMICHPAWDFLFFTVCSKMKMSIISHAYWSFCVPLTFKSCLHYQNITCFKPHFFHQGLPWSSPREVPPVLGVPMWFYTICTALVLLFLLVQ